MLILPERYGMIGVLGILEQGATTAPANDLAFNLSLPEVLAGVTEN